MTPEHEWPELPAFEATVRRRAHIGLPESGRLGPGDPLPLVEGTADVVVLRFAPSKRLRSPDPLHEAVYLELASPLDASAAGLLSLAAAACRAGGERLAFQSTHAVGTVHYAGRQGSAYVLDLDVRFVNPDLDDEHLGTRALAGRVLVEP